MLTKFGRSGPASAFPDRPAHIGPHVPIGQWARSRWFPFPIPLVHICSHNVSCLYLKSSKRAFDQETVTASRLKIDDSLPCPKTSEWTTSRIHLPTWAVGPAATLFPIWSFPQGIIRLASAQGAKKPYIRARWCVPAPSLMLDEQCDRLRHHGP